MRLRQLDKFLCICLVGLLPIFKTSQAQERTVDLDSNDIVFPSRDTSDLCYYLKKGEFNRVEAIITNYCPKGLTICQAKDFMAWIYSHSCVISVEEIKTQQTDFLSFWTKFTVHFSTNDNTTSCQEILIDYSPGRTSIVLSKKCPDNEGSSNKKHINNISDNQIPNLIKQKDFEGIRLIISKYISDLPKDKKPHIYYEDYHDQFIAIKNWLEAKKGVDTVVLELGLLKLYPGYKYMHINFVAGTDTVYKRLGIKLSDPWEISLENSAQNARTFGLSEVILDKHYQEIDEISINMPIYLKDTNTVIESKEEYDKLISKVEYSPDFAFPNIDFNKYTLIGVTKGKRGAKQIAVERQVVKALTTKEYKIFIPYPKKAKKCKRFRINEWFIIPKAEPDYNFLFIDKK